MDMILGILAICGALAVLYLAIAAWITYGLYYHNHKYRGSLRRSWRSATAWPLVAIGVIYLIIWDKFRKKEAPLDK